MGKGKKLPLIKEVEISDVGAEGKAIAKIEGMIIFIPYVVPGDIVDVQVVKKRSSYMEALPVTFRKYSDIRRQAACEHFGICGGCKWQNLPYQQQLKYKQKQVVDNFTRIGKLEIPDVSTIIPSEKDFFYRNKLEFTFSDNRWLTREEIESGASFDRKALGFHIPEMYDKVLDIKKCWLQNDPSNAIRDAIKQFALENELPFYNFRNQQGFLRNLIIRTASTGELMVILSFFSENEVLRNNLLEFIRLKFPEITSLMYVINQKVNDTITDQEIILYSGKDHIIEKIEGLKYKIGPKSFFQTNTEQAYKLYKIVREFSEFTGNEVVYDLYTGTGTIAIFVSNQSKKVIGIEFVSEAVENAKENAKLNNISNIDFYAGDIKDILNEDFINEQGRPDVIILDPPRAGVHQNVIEALLLTLPKRVIYVSCNPATQARDLSSLKEHYRITAIQPVDMFPQTHHVENVVRLDRI